MQILEICLLSSWNWYDNKIRHNNIWIVRLPQSHFFITINQILGNPFHITYCHYFSNNMKSISNQKNQKYVKCKMLDHPADSDLLILTQSLVTSETHGFGPNQKSAGLARGSNNILHSAIGGTPFIYVKCGDSQVFPHTQSTVFVWIDWSFFWMADQEVQARPGKRKYKPRVSLNKIYHFMHGARKVKAFFLHILSNPSFMFC